MALERGGVFMSNWRKWKQLTIGTLSIVASAVIVGLTANAFHPRGIPLRYSDFERMLKEREEMLLKPRLPAGVEMVEFERAWVLFTTHKAKFVDARSRSEYETGHIPGAINLPPAPDEFEASFKVAKDKLKKEALIIVYCSGGS
jgi:hypothetical protein